MDFGTRAPESNSGRMHSGPGAGSLMDAAKAWGVLGAQLADTALTYRAVIAELELGDQRASTTAITQAVAPYLAWLDATAARARQTATQATAAAGAYGLALAAVVAPHVIAANRLRRISLAEANCLGQLSPAVADADADYERMWAQDAAAMYAYARASAGVWKLTPFDSPPPAADPAPAGVTSPSRNWALTAAPEVITTGRQVISTISDALGALSVSPLATFDTSLLSATGALSRLSSLSAPLDFALNHLSALNKAAALGRAAVMCSPRPGGRRAGRGDRDLVGPTGVDQIGAEPGVAEFAGGSPRSEPVSHPPATATDADGCPPVAASDRWPCGRFRRRGGG